MMLFLLASLTIGMPFLFAASDVVLLPNGISAQPVMLEESEKVSKYINHFIIIIQGRHTFDNYFGTFPRVDGISNNTMIPINPFKPQDTTYIEPFHINPQPNYKPRDDPPTYRLSYNNGKMDGFIFAQKNTTGNPINVMGYFDNSDIPYYWKLASEYVLAQRFFSPSMKSDLVNSLYAIDVNPPLNLQEVPIGGLDTNETIFDSMEANNISWSIYIENLNRIHNQTNEENRVLYRSIPILAVPRFVNNQSLNSNIHDLSEYNADVFSNRFANLTYVYFTDSNDSPTSNVVSSQELVSNLIYILMKSQFWNSSAILLTHNEAGGWYDHVKPPMNNNTGEISGFRVPAIIISPYAKKSYIDSNIHDIRSFLDLVQSSFGIQRNTSFANHTNDISEVFNFEQQPRNPLFLQEVLKERIIVQPEEIEWINVIYIASPVLPFIVTLYWYFMKRRSKNAR